MSNIVQFAFKSVGYYTNKFFSNPYKKAGISALEIKKCKYLPRNQERSITAYGHSLYFVNPIEVLHGIKELFIEEIYKQNLPENATIIDCGSHIGLSVIYLKHICPTAHITAFEPDENNFKLLAKNVASYQFTNVQLENKAIWVSNDDLYFSSGQDMSSHIELDSDDHSKDILVKAQRLKDLLNKRIDFLKIDIEGSEYEVLKDVKEDLGNVQNLFVEYHSTFDEAYKLSEILQIIIAAGFTYYLNEAVKVYDSPFLVENKHTSHFDIQLNIFCKRLK